MGYYFLHPLIAKYCKLISPKGTTRAVGTIQERFGYPLVYEPGSSWEYSCSMDWIGLAVARLAKTDFETYCQTHIFGPLNITDFTFWLDRHPNLKSRLIDMTMRDGTNSNIPEGKRGLQSIGGITLLDAYETEHELGGQGLYGSMPSFLKILHSILADDEKLLSRKTTATMFEPQLSSASQRALQEIFDLPEDDPNKKNFVTKFPVATYDWGLGGVLTTSDIQNGNQNWMRKGCLMWSGLPNLNWVSNTSKLLLWAL